MPGPWEGGSKAENGTSYPVLQPLPSEEPETGKPTELAGLQRLAAENSPLLREALRNADDALGAVNLAGLCVDPRVGYQVVERQPPSLIRTVGDDGVPGHQGLFIARLIDTAAVLDDGQRVAGFAYVNALVELGKAKTGLESQVRTYLCLALMAKREIEVNRALVELADGVYQMRLKRLAAGEAAGDEPRQLYVQAVEARNSLLQSQIAYKSACQHLATLIGKHDLTMPPLVGRADMVPPRFDFEIAKARMLATHPALLAERFDMVQAMTTPKPQAVTGSDSEIDRGRQREIRTPAYMPGMHLDLGTRRFERLIGPAGPDHWHTESASENYRLTENGLRAKLAEAFGRYEANVEIAANFREKVIPSLARAYREMVRRHQADPRDVELKQVVAAQRTLAKESKNYLGALGAQWRAVLDIASLSQPDELMPDK